MDGGAPTTDGAELDRLLRELAALEALAEGWGLAERAGAAARARAVDALNAEALRRLIRAVRPVPEAAEALRAAATDPLVYSVLRRHGILKPSLQERVETALDTVRPMLASHGGDVELVAVAGASVEVRFLGACDGCPASALTFYAGVKTAIESHAPEITEVRQAKGLGGGRSRETNVVSPFAATDAAGWTRALGLADLAEGRPRFIEIEGTPLILTRFGDAVTCFADACAHMGLGMEGGPVEDGILACPHHGFRYALDSGECLTAPQVQLQPVPLRVRGSDIDVRLDAGRPS